MTKRTPISVLIPAQNQEANVAEALRSVDWADEAYVVDSRSSDRTTMIASKLGAKVIYFDYKGWGPRKIAWALQNVELRNDWVLLLSPMERVTTQLRDQIVACLALGGAEAYSFRRRDVFLGRTLRCSQSDWLLRVFKKQLTHFDEPPSGVPDIGDTEIRERVVVSGRVRRLGKHLLHHDLRPLRALVEQHARSFQWEADIQWEMRGEPTSILDMLSTDRLAKSLARKRLWGQLPCRPTLRFLMSYVVRLGFLDGRAGLDYSRLLAYKEFLISLSVREYEVGLERARHGRRFDLGRDKSHLAPPREPAHKR